MKKKKVIKLFIILICFLFPKIFFTQKIFKEFKNVDSLTCFEKSYPFYYHFEKEFVINDIVINEFNIGTIKNKSQSFWIGKDNKNVYYSLIVSRNYDKIIKKRKLFLDKNSEFLISNNMLKLKFKKKSFISQNIGFIYTYTLYNQSSLKKIFDERYSNFYIIFSEEKGLEISFDYIDKNINTMYGGCDKL